MTEFPAFAVAVVGLLAVPGPTNTLLATAGAATGVRAALRLLPGEIGGYLVAIGFFTQAVAPLIAGLPAVPVVIKILAGAYLVWLAARLWRDPGSATTVQANNPIRLRDVFLTTLLNPKALIFAFAIFPSGRTFELLPYALMFSVLVVGCGGAWVLLGDTLRRSSGGFATRRRVARASAIVLAVFAVTLAGSAVAPFVT